MAASVSNSNRKCCELVVERKLLGSLEIIGRLSHALAREQPTRVKYHLDDIQPAIDAAAWKEVGYCSRPNGCGWKQQLGLSWLWSSRVHPYCLSLAYYIIHGIGLKRFGSKLVRFPLTRFTCQLASKDRPGSVF